MGVVGLAKEPKIEPLSEVARRGLVDAEPDRRKVIARGGARADAICFAQATNAHDAQT